MINVLRLITWLPVGGIEQKLVAILPMIQASGKYRVRICCLREAGPLAPELEKAGVPVTVIPFQRRWDLKALGRLKALIVEQRIDVVHSHMYRSNVPGTVAGRRAGAAVVIAQIHNVDTWDTWRQLWMDRFLMRWRDAVVCVSEAVRRDVCKRIWAPKDKTRVIYNGVDVARFSSPDREARPRLRAEWGLPEGAVAGLMLARLHPQKNPLGLLEAFERAAAAAPMLRLIYAGDGPQREELEREIRRRGLEARARLIGMRMDVPDVLSACDFCVLPSLKEGFSNTVLEAMAAGRPVLCSNVGGNAEVITHGQCGYIVEPGDPVDLARALERFGPDAALRQALTEAGRARVQRFSLDQMARDTMDLYEELLMQAIYAH